MAVAGRANTQLDPPYIAWVVRFGKLQGKALWGSAPSALAMALMRIDPNKGGGWVEKSIARKSVLVGNRAMLAQNNHQRGIPVVFVAQTAIFALVSDDDRWIEEVITSLPEG